MIQAEDLFPGRYVTVLRGAKTKVRTIFGTSFNHEHNALLASVLRVKGLSLPYVAVEVLYDASGNFRPAQVIALDTRVMQFALVDESYARALVPPELLRPPTQHTPKPPPSPPSDWGMSIAAPDPEMPVIREREYVQALADKMGQARLSIAKADCDICGGRDFEHAKTCVRHPANRAKRKQ